MGGSTNAVLHLLAIAHEMGVDLSSDDFERIGRGIPGVCGVKPSGKYEQLDLHRAGGLPAIEKRIDRFMHGDALNVSGVTVEQIIKDAVIADDAVIRPLNDPFYEGGGLAIMHGNLAPNTGVIKALSLIHISWSTSPTAAPRPWPTASARRRSWTTSPPRASTPTPCLLYTSRCV